MDLDAVATSFNTALALMAAPFCLLTALTVATVFSNTPSVSVPCVLAKRASCDASVTPNPNCFVKAVMVIKVSPPKSETIPVDCTKSLKLLLSAMELTNALSVLRATIANSR